MFHLPRAFKKSKLGKRFSHHENFDKRDKDKGLSLSDMDLTSHDIAAVKEEPSPAVSSQQQPSRRTHTTAETEADVVPMEEKTAALIVERANEAGTEEAVVPFADKGLT